MKKVLIIDDDPRNIYALSAVLKSRRYNCIPALDGAEAVKLLGEHKDIEILLVDMMMPGMDGTELIHLIRQQFHDRLPIVAVTALAMVGDKEKCLAAGADAYISKPVDIDKLLNVMTDLLDNSGTN